MKYSFIRKFPILPNVELENIFTLLLPLVCAGLPYSRSAAYSARDTARNLPIIIVVNLFMDTHWIKKLNTRTGNVVFLCRQVRWQNTSCKCASLPGEIFLFFVVDNQ